MNLFWIWFWLAVGNCTYQYFGSGNWSEAFDRTYFQGVAIIGVWFVATVRRRTARPSTKSSLEAE